MDLVGFLSWLELSALGYFVRESGPWTYALVNLAHVLGVALLFGAVVTLDLRLLGFWRHVPVASLAAPAAPLAAGGLALAMASGVVLLSAQATDYAGNPFLALKLVAVAAGCANALILGRTGAWRRLGEFPPAGRDRAVLAVAGGVSLLCWLAAIGCGRMIGYL